MIDLDGIESKHALFLEACWIEEGISLINATARTVIMRNCRLGSMNLTDTRITGQLDLTGTQLITSDEPALQADGLSVTGSVSCADGFQAQGEVRLVGANIGGHLIFNGASLTGQDRPALNGDRLTVAQNKLCGQSPGGGAFRAVGGVRLMWANVGGQLALRGAKLTGGHRQALNAYGLTVKGDMI